MDRGVQGLLRTQGAIAEAKRLIAAGKGDAAEAAFSLNSRAPL